MGLRQFSDQMSRLTTSISGVGSTSHSAGRQVGGLEDTLESLGNETVATRKRSDGLKESVGKLGTALKALDHGFNKYVTGWRDASNSLINGSRLQNLAFGENRKTQERMTAFTADFVKRTGANRDEATLAVKNMMEGWKEYNQSMSMDEMTRQAEEYKAVLGGVQQIAGVSARESADFVKQLQIQAGIGFDESMEVMKNLSKATVAYGVAGADTIKGVTESFDTLMALDVKDRAKQIAKMANYTGMQGRAIVDFGKYVDKLVGNEGVDPYVKAAKLSAFGGGAGANDTLRDMMLAKGKDPGATLRLMEMQIKAIETTTPGLLALQRASLTGRKADGSEFTGSDANDLMIKQEKFLQTVGTVSDLSVMDAATMDAALKKTEALGLTGEDLLAKVQEEVRLMTDANKAYGKNGLTPDAAGATMTREQAERSTDADIAGRAIDLADAFTGLEASMRKVQVLFDYLTPIAAGVTAVGTGLVGLVGGLAALRVGIGGLAALRGGGGALVGSLMGGGGGAALRGAGGAAMRGAGGAALKAAPWLIAADAARQLGSESGREGVRNASQKDMDRIHDNGAVLGGLENYARNWINPSTALAQTVLGGYDTIQVLKDAKEAEVMVRKMDAGLASMQSVKDSFAARGLNVSARDMTKAMQRGDSAAISTLSRTAIPIQAQHNLASKLHVALTERGYTADYGFLLNEVQSAYARGETVDLDKLISKPGVSELGLEGTGKADDAWQTELSRQAEWWGARGATLDTSGLNRGSIKATIAPLNEKVPVETTVEPETPKDRKDRTEERSLADNLQGLLNDKLNSVISLLDAIHRDRDITAPV